MISHCKGRQWNRNIYKKKRLYKRKKKTGKSKTHTHTHTRKKIRRDKNGGIENERNVTIDGRVVVVRQECTCFKIRNKYVCTTRVIDKSVQYSTVRRELFVWREKKETKRKREREKER